MSYLDTSWKEAPYLQTVFDAFDGQLRFVGGCVRDALAAEAVSDIDMATPLTPEQSLNCLQAHRIKAIPTGIKFGTITAVIAGETIEITSLRKDFNCDGRHANVTFTTDWEEDAARRDFTFNALSMDRHGKIYDYFGGRSDLLAGHARFIGNAKERCQEDYLRILRFFRFHSRFGKGPIDAAGLRACTALAPELKTLSPERITQEMLKLLTTKSAGQTLEIMQEHDILAQFMPPSIALKPFARLCALPETNHSILRLASLLRGAEKNAATDMIGRYWRFSNAEKKLLEQLSRDKNILDRAGDIWALRKVIRRFGKEVATMLYQLELSENAEKLDADMVEKELQSWQIPLFPLRGKDLLKAGIPAGEKVGKLLKKAENWWEEGHYEADKKALLEYIGTSPPHTP